jgi:Periplasmic binding protein-like domain
VGVVHRGPWNATAALAGAAFYTVVADPDAPTRRVAVVVPHISRWFFAAMLEALESVLREADLDVLLYHVGDAADRRAFSSGSRPGARSTRSWSSHFRIGGRAAVPGTDRPRIPDDISVIGIDDHPLAELTTVSQPVRQQGLLVDQMVFGQLQGQDIERATTMSTKLVIRRSTAPPSWPRR